MFEEVIDVFEYVMFSGDWSFFELLWEGLLYVLLWFGYEYDGVEDESFWFVMG